MLDKKTMEMAQRIWDFHHVNHTLNKADCILALGSHDIRVAERAAEIHLQGWAPILIFSGGLGNLTHGVWTETEADKFAAVAEKMGVSRENILIENKSTNTGENIQFTQQLLSQKGLNPESFIVVQKPYMERRSYATFKKNWPEKDLVVTSPQLAFTDYPNSEITLEDVIHIMVGDLQRIKLYPNKGFQIYQEIPVEIWEAYQQLVNLGFINHMIS